MITLTLKSGGILEKEELNPSEKTHTIENVASQAMCYLFYPVVVAENVLLKDLFLLLNGNLEIFDNIFGNWCEDWVTEGLKEGKKPENLASIYVEHFFTIQKIGSKKVLDGTECPRCHLSGIEPGKTYGIGQIAACDLAQLPLVLKQEGMLWKDTEVSFTECTYTLGQIIQGILWELSWHGSPTKTEDFWNEMEKRVEDIVNLDPKTEV